MATLVADPPSRQVLSLNQQTYQRLKLALRLNLRRQIFIVVCDNLVLRDRLLAQLQLDLAPPASRTTPYPSLVSLQLDLRELNPAAQMQQWFAHSSFKTDDRALAPTFQLLGVEQLTRQPASQQRRFLTCLQGIDRSLASLEASLLLWLPQPWYRSIPQSAAEFWQCRTGVFEFAGDPTPLPQAIPQGLRRNIERPLAANQSPPKQMTARQRVESVAAMAKTDVWKILAHDLAQLDKAAEARPKTDPKAASQSNAAELPPVAKGSREPPIATEVAAAPHLQEQESAARIELPTALIDAQRDRSDGLEAASLSDSSPISIDPQAASLLQQIEQLQQQQATPIALAQAYQNLGHLYRDRVEQGDASLQNLAAAIQAYQQMLMWLPESSPLWADVLNDLGNLCWMLSRSTTDSAQTLPQIQQAVQCYQLALSKTDVQHQPQDYAMTQNNLGSAYADLARYHDPIDNLQRSIQAYQEALRFRQPDAEPLRYAATQNNLGTAYWNLAQHQQPSLNLQQAIAAYSQALCYYTPEGEPLSYAMLQNNLGTTYWNLSQHDRSQDWLNLALVAYREALRYRTLNGAPAAFAATQSNLGMACLNLANAATDRDQRFDYLQQAIVAQAAAIEAAERLAASLQPVVLSFDLSATHNNLGLASYQLAVEPQFSLSGAERAACLKTALHHHLQALQGWQHQADLRQTAIAAVVQTVREIYSQTGLSGQSTALSMIPGHLLPAILPQL